MNGETANSAISERESKKTSLTVPLDTAWFDREPERYLCREDFIDFQKIAGVDFSDLLSKNPEVAGKAQEQLVRMSVILNEIQKLHFGFGFPFLVYTHNLHFGDARDQHNEEVDKTIFAFDMCDSLRRRHVALSHTIIPMAIRDLHKTMNRPLAVKNLGAGVGLDTLNATRQTDGAVATVLNYDTSRQAVDLGERITRYLEDQNVIKPGVVRYKRQSLAESIEMADLIIKIGVICGLRDEVAAVLLAEDFMHLNEGGKLIVSSSNHNMKCKDPLSSFLIQHIVTKDNPFSGWGLNCRTEEQLRTLLTQAGFNQIDIHGDHDYPGYENLPEKIRCGVDTLPAEVAGFPHDGIPLRLPPEEVRDQCISYNWIAVATKK